MTDCAHNNKSKSIDCATELLAARKEVMKLRTAMVGKVLMPLTPDMSTEMKSTHLGEYRVKFPLACHECEGEQGHEGCKVCEGNGQYMHEINIPWTVCKKIFQAMYATAVKQAQNEQSTT